MVSDTTIIRCCWFLLTATFIPTRRRCSVFSYSFVIHFPIPYGVGGGDLRNTNVTRRRMYRCIPHAPLTYHHLPSFLPRITRSARPAASLTALPFPLLPRLACLPPLPWRLRLHHPSTSISTSKHRAYGAVTASHSTVSTLPQPSFLQLYGTFFQPDSSRQTHLRSGYATTFHLVGGGRW